MTAFTTYTLQAKRATFFYTCNNLKNSPFFQPDSRLEMICLNQSACLRRKAGMSIRFHAVLFQCANGIGCRFTSMTPDSPVSEVFQKMWSVPAEWQSHLL